MSPVDQFPYIFPGPASKHPYTVNITSH